MNSQLKMTLDSYRTTKMLTLHQKRTCMARERGAVCSLLKLLKNNDHETKPSMYLDKR